MTKTTTKSEEAKTSEAGAAGERPPATTRPNGIAAIGDTARAYKHAWDQIAARPLCGPEHLHANARAALRERGWRLGDEHHSESKTSPLLNHWSGLDPELRQEVEMMHAAMKRKAEEERAKTDPAEPPREAVAHDRRQIAPETPRGRIGARGRARK